MRPLFASLRRRAAFLLLAAAPFASAAERPPNVLLIITDQQQAEAMSVFLGTRELRTPNMDRLAASGVAFTRAYAANPRCTPSRCSMFSGYYPHQTGVQENDPTTPDGFRTPLMGRFFAEAGYDTVYFGKYHMPADDAAQHGFAVREHLRSVGQDEAATNDAVSFLRQKHERPFLLVVSYCNPHNICEYGRNEALPDGPLGTPPPVSACPPAVPNPLLPRGECDPMVEQRALRGTLKEYDVLERYTADDWRRYRWAYYRMIEKVDAQLGRVLTALHEAGASENTFVVQTSDHGESAGAHGFSEKVVFYEESVRVPLVLAWPGHFAPARNAQLVNTGVDLLPTLLDCAGIRKSDLPGRSLRATAEGTGTVGAASPEYVVSENLMRAGEVPVNGRMVRTARFKYCVFDRGARNEALFDELHDPLETVNLAYDAAHAGDVRRARELLREHARRFGDAVAEQCLAKIADAPVGAAAGETRAPAR